MQFTQIGQPCFQKSAVSLSLSSQPTRVTVIPRLLYALWSHGNCNLSLKGTTGSPNETKALKHCYLQYASLLGCAKFS